MPRRSLLAALLALLTLLGACTGGDGQDLPQADRLLTQSAQAMRQVDTVRFDIDIQGSGTVGGFPIQGAQGQLTRQGDAQGTVRLDQFGQLVELRFVLVGDSLFLEGPTGGFQELSASFAAQIYDPSTILDPDSGVPALLGRARMGTTEAREQVNGVDAYRVRATFPGLILQELVPGLSSDTQGTVWIGVDGNRLVQARFPLSGPGQDPGQATVRLSDFGAPADITAPQ